MQRSTREKEVTLTLARPEKSAPAALTSTRYEDECEFPSSRGRMFSLSPRESVETHGQYSSDGEHYSNSSADAAGGASVASGASSQQHAAESVASECSVSSTDADGYDGAGGDANTSSKPQNGGVKEDSKLISDADSAPSCEDEDEEKKKKNIKRCASGGSIVTYDQAGSKSKLRDGDGECERTGDRRLVRRAKETQLNATDDPGAADINAEQQMANSPVPAWTDDKHHSYLNSIEQTFVNSLYGQNHHTVDGSGQDDQDCVESRPMDGGFPYGCEPFTILQKGCYDQGEYYRPQFLHHSIPSPAIFLSPWIQHFNPKTGGPSNPSPGGGAPASQDGAAGTAAEGAGVAGGGFVDGEYPGTGPSGSGTIPEDVKEEVMESNPEVPEAVPSNLQPRTSSWYHSQHYHSTAPIRPDGTSGVAKKRPGNVDATDDFRPKKLKSTQRLLAAIDLEMEEQFVLEQKYLKKKARGSRSKAATEHQQRPQQEQQQPTRPGGENVGGLDLNQAAQELDEETTIALEDLAATAKAHSPEKQQRTPAKVIEFITPFEGPVKTNVRTIGEEGPVANELSSDPEKAEHHHDHEASKSVERRSAEGDGTDRGELILLALMATA